MIQLTAKRVTYGLGIVAAVLLVCAIGQRVQALNIGDSAPQSNRSNPKGVHVFNIRKRPSLGVSRNLNLEVYIPSTITKNQWNSGYIEINDADQNLNTAGICEVVDGSGSEYVTVSAEIGGVEKVYNIQKSRVCAKKNGKNLQGSRPANALYATYALPDFPGGDENKDINGNYLYADPETGMFKVTFNVRYGASTESIGFEAGHANFKVLADSISGAKVSQGEPNGTGSFPLQGNVQPPKPRSTIDIPFGLSCSISDTRTREAGLYDADNGGFPYDINLRVYKTFDYDPSSGESTSYGENNWQEVQFNNGSGVGGSLTNNRKVFTPANGNKEKAYALVNLDPYDSYILRIDDYHTDNAIDVVLPDESIFGDEKTCQGFNLDGKSSVDQSQAAIGESVTFTHELKNVGLGKSDPYEYWVRWTQYTSGTTPRDVDANSHVTDRRLGPNTAMTPKRSNALVQPFEIPEDAQNGDKFCQDIRWLPDRSFAPNSSDNSDEACVEVYEPPGQRKVSVKTLVCVDAECGSDAEVEAASGAVVTSKVVVTGFPGTRIGELSSYTNGNETNVTPNCQNNGSGRCYVPARFRLTCDRGGSSTTINVDANGTYCEQTEPAYNTIGEYECIPLAVSKTDASNGTNGFRDNNTYAEPGYKINRNNGNRNIDNSWNIGLENNTNCVRVYGKPYLKIYGGDIRVGSTVAVTGECSANRSNVLASIHASNRQVSAGEYRGASVQNAAFALGDISDFVSGKAAAISQFSGTKSRSFANTLNGDFQEFGGGFDEPQSGACAEFDYTPGSTATQEINGTTLTGRSTSGITGSLTEYASGDVYIRSNITYAGSAGWASPQDIPQYKLIVRGGDIYIDANVTQLDGIFVSTQNAGAVAPDAPKGRIYTCATRSGTSPPERVKQTFTNCTTRLVVNGSLIAKQIHFLRDCSTVSKGSAAEAVQFTGGTIGQSQLCSNTNRAAEIINYSPESWIPNAVGAKQSGYDSITSLPPVL